LLFSQGEEVLFLPTIVEPCESSPSAAKESAHLIRKFLSKDNFGKPYLQYNAIMLIRILSDNPGKTFTRNLDSKFVQTVKELLRVGRDPSVKQILMETLETFQRDKADDEGCAQLNEMWKKEHERMVKIHVCIRPFTEWVAILIASRVQQVHEYSTLLLSIPTAKTTSLETITAADSLLPTNYPPASKKPKRPRSCFHRRSRAHHPPNCYKMNLSASSLIAAKAQAGACKHT
jgi:hypothetical protein